MKKALFILTGIALFSGIAHSQMINSGVDAFLQGNLVEVGIDGTGGFEGAPWNTASPPIATAHYRSGNPYFGFVANPQVNAWATFDGDFFTPGTPENGWGMELIDGAVDIKASNNCNIFTDQIPGSITGYSVVGTCKMVDWEGNYIASGYNLHFHVNYQLKMGDLFYTTTVSITNNGGTSIPDFYYYRNVDPDNDEPISFNFTTTNTIVSQPSGPCLKAHVSATQSSPWLSYMGFAGVGANFRVAKGGFSNRDGSDIWNGLGSMTSSGVSTADEAIAIGYRINPFAPGTTQTFKYVVILDDAAANNAINGLFYFTYTGSLGPPPSCTPTTYTASTCSGQPVTITLNATGSATSAFNWTWSPATGLSATTGTVVNAAPTTTTTYTVTGTSPSGCFAPVTQTITVNVVPGPHATYVNPGPQCGSFDLSTLSIQDANHVPGAITHFYTVPPANLSMVGSNIYGGTIITPTSPPIYLVYYDPVLGCIDYVPVIITWGSASPVVNSATICNGSSATLTATGASTYTWSPATGLSATTGASVTASPTTTTTYTITGTSSGCTGTTTSTVTVNPLPVISVPAASKCASAPGVVMTATGASTYTWSPSTGLSATTGASVTANPAATTTYTITGTSASGCVGSTTSTLTVNPNPVITVPSATICNGSSTPLTASGASTYTWSPATGLSATTGTSVTANPTTTTTYTITGTSVAGCTGTTTSTVTVNPTPVVTANNVTVCSGASATLTASGASSYTWSPATGLSATTGSSVTSTVASTTTYTVTGTTSGCNGTTTSTVMVNPLPTITVPPATICTGSSATLTASGASTYTWSPATGLSATTGTSVTANPATTTTYTVTGTSGSGCVNTTTVTVTVNPLPTVTVPGATICNGASTTLTASGASTYTWSPATGLSATTGTSVTANPSSTTTYTITGTSAAGCTNTTTSTVTVNPVPVITATNVNVCSGSPATLTASGASTYTWSPATGLSATTGSSVTSTVASTTTYTVTGTSLGCTGTTTATVTMSAMLSAAITPAGPYCQSDSPATMVGADPGGSWSATCGTCINAATGVFDPSLATPGVNTITYSIPGGCGDTQTTNVTVNPTPDVVATPSTATICSGQTTGIALSSAVGGATFDWTQSASGVTGSADGSGASIAQTLTSSAAPGGTVTYTVTPTASGCVGSPINVDINVQEVAINSINVTPALCNGSTDGIITINATGATQYSIDGGGTFQAGNTFTVGANIYNVVVQNANGCQATGSATVTEPAALAAPTSSTPESCFGACNGIGGTAPTGGTAPYTYSWSVAGSGNVPFLSGLCSGTYTVDVTDAHGCLATSSVTITGPAAVTITSTTPTQPSCFGGNNGSLVINASASATQFSVNNGASFQTSNTFNTLIAGTYNIVVTDASGCSATTTAVIGQPTAVTISASPDVSICLGHNTVISASGSGGTGAYTYTWDNGLPAGATQSVSPSVTTTYNVSMTDANGCGPVTESVTVTVAPALSVETSSNQTICPGGAASISALATGGGGAPYTYTWTNSVDGSVITTQSGTVSPSANAIYTVTVSDACGSPMATDTMQVNLFVMPAVLYNVDNTQGCAPVVVNFSDVTANAASCAWDFGDGSTDNSCNAQHVFNNAGCYNIGLTVTTNDGCVVDTTILQQICVYAMPVADFSFSPMPADIFDPEISFTNLTLNGDTYSWDFAGLGSSQVANPGFTFPADSGGHYQVCLSAITDHGCTDSACHVVTIIDQFLIYVPNSFTPDGDGRNDIFLPRLQGENPETYELYIFDRWGEVIFQSNNLMIGWDGTHNGIKAKEDVYVWKIKVKKSMNQDKKEFLGHVNLLR